MWEPSVPVAAGMAEESLTMLLLSGSGLYWGWAEAVKVSWRGLKPSLTWPSTFTQ